MWIIREGHRQIGQLLSLIDFFFSLQNFVDTDLVRWCSPEEAIKLLEFEKETWQMLMNKLSSGQPGDASMNVTGAQQTAISSLSANG